jgi:hypothetical protein
MPVQVTIGGAETERQFRALGSVFRKTDAPIKNALTRTLRAELKPVVVELKQAAASIPSQGAASSKIVAKNGRVKKAPTPKRARQPLRRVIASSIFVGVSFKGKTAGAAIAMKRGQLETIFGGKSARALPELLDSTYLGTFSHPAINQPGVTVRQKAYDWFWPVWSRHEERVALKVHAAVIATIERLSRGV